ncbi:MAG: patatin-like phospholipase family protein [Muribaculaceae bacterium]|nr:patatin-like phospholipase family protein [Muribaculaceae bacterium]
MKHKTLVILATLLATAAMQAADKVGLVLSGGGAKGVAHVGVIKALEDNDIPIDYVAGTSMGSIVGSLYCCGWTPDSMLNMMTSKDFLDWSSGTINKNNLSFVSTPDPTPEWGKISFGSDNTNIANQVLPKSLIDPTPMNIEFLKLFTPYTQACGGDFDKLFVPFRCVFSDVYKKHKVVCRKGSLGESVRGSMSFPLVYRSIMVDSILAFDGGIYDNFPVDVMHEDFNPDFIIGVSVSKPDGKPNVNNMYSELEDLIIQNNDYSLDPELGIKIQVPVTNFGVLSFDEAQEIYNIGYQTGLQWVDSIKSRLKARRPLAEVSERRARFAEKVPEISFTSVSTPGVTGKDRDYLVSVFTSRERKTGRITMEDVEESYYNVISQGDVYELLPEANGEELILKANIKQPWRASAGGWLSTGVGSYIYAGMGYHSLKKNSVDALLSLWGGQSYIAVQFNGRIRLNSYNPSYISLEGVASKKKYYDNLPFFFSTKNIESFVSNVNFVRMAYEVGQGRSALFKLSAAYGEQYKVKVAKGKLEYEYNTLGQKTFAETGRRFYAAVSGMRMETKNYIEKDPLPSEGRIGSEFSEAIWRGKIDVLWNNYYSVNHNFNIGALIQGGMSIGKRFNDTKTDLMTSSSFMPLESMDNCYVPELRGDDFVAVGAIPIWKLFQRIQLRGDAYLYTKFRDSSQWQAPFSKTQFLGRVSLVGTLPFASIAVFSSYSTALRGWNFGVNIGWFVPSPKL